MTQKKTNISWTDYSWNPAVGCTKVDADCKYCYMYRDSMNGKRFDPKIVRQTTSVFNKPLSISEPSKIFTASYTDFFHVGLDSFRDDCWGIIRKCPQHIFQILTKRPERIINHLPKFWEEIQGRVWMGTSVGSQESIDRMIQLSMLDIDCVKFLSLEPLHGMVDLVRATVNIRNEDFHVLPAFDWVIVGGESGNETGQYRYRECKLEWIEKIVTDCKRNDIPVFVKQMGTHLSKKLGMSARHGDDVNEFPEHLRIQNFPTYRGK